MKTATFYWLLWITWISLSLSLSMDIFIPSTSASSRSKSLTLSVVRYNNDHVFYPKLMLTGSRLSRPHCILAHVFWDSVLSLTGPACYEKICSPSATVFFVSFPMQWLRIGLSRQPASAAAASPRLDINHFPLLMSARLITAASSPFSTG